MAGVVGKYAAKKVLGQQMEKYRSKKVAGDDDPYFVEVPGRRGKMKKVKRQIPDFIPEHDAKCLASAKSLAYKMDMALFTFAGVRFGWGSVIGLIPSLGDIVDLFFALQVYKRCKAVEGGLPSGIQSRMTLNIIIDFVIGIIPFIGDLADAAYRCNTKNVMLLEKHLRQKYGPDDKKARETAGFEMFDDDPDFHHGADAAPPYEGVLGSDRPAHTSAPTHASEPARHNDSQKSGGWTKRSKEGDLEMGRVPVSGGHA